MVLLAVLLGGDLAAQFKADDQLEKELRFEKTNPGNVLRVANINGNIEVRNYSGTAIKITAKRTISAKTEERLGEGKSIDLGVKDLYDTLIVYLTGVCGDFSKNNESWGKQSDNWSYNWNNCEERFNYRLDFLVEVPRGQHLVLSTINDGDIMVDGISGNLMLRNINGSISVDDPSGKLKARTVNGDVTLEFNSLPTQPLDLYTLNGDINMNYPGQLNADVSFKSFNGDLYTNENDYQQMPMKMVASESSNIKGGVTQKLESRSMIRLGRGGLDIQLETFNGNAYLKNTNNN